MTCRYASRSAHDPVADAFSMRWTGTPVSPSSFTARTAVMAEWKI